MRRVFDWAFYFGGTALFVMTIVAIVLINLSTAYSIVQLRARDEVQKIRTQDIERDISKLTKVVLAVKSELNELRPKPQNGIWLGPPPKKKGKR